MVAKKRWRLPLLLLVAAYLVGVLCFIEERAIFSDPYHIAFVTYHLGAGHRIRFQHDSFDDGDAYWHVMLEDPRYSFEHGKFYSYYKTVADSRWRYLILNW